MRTSVATLLLLIASPLASAQTSFPMVTHVSPVAVERGTTSEVTVSCRTSSLANAYKVLFDGTGVAAEIVPPKSEPKIDPKSPVPVLTALTLKVTVAADAPVGVRELSHCHQARHLVAWATGRGRCPRRSGEAGHQHAG